MKKTLQKIKHRFEAQLLSYWYPCYNNKSSWFLLAVPALYSLKLVYFIVWQRRYVQRQKLSESSKRPCKPFIIVVGNITVGGTGKTPLLIECAQQLMQRGYKVGVLSRGYGGSHARNVDHAHLIEPQDSSKLVGDEPQLIYNTLNRFAKTLEKNLTVPVAIAAKRMLGLELLCKEYSLDIILSDDGLQHYALPRDYEIVVVDGQRGFGNSKLLPQGPLREPLTALACTDAVVSNGQSSPFLAQQLALHNAKTLKMDVTLGTVKALNTSCSNAVSSIDDLLTNYDATYAIAGIGNPQRFFIQLEQAINDLKQANKSAENRLITEAFADHYNYQQQDFDRIVSLLKNTTSKAAILMTEKDAVKCQLLAEAVTIPVYSIGTKVTLDDHFIAGVIERYQQYANSI